MRNYAKVDRKPGLPAYCTAATFQSRKLSELAKVAAQRNFQKQALKNK